MAPKMPLTKNITVTYFLDTSHIGVTKNQCELAPDGLADSVTRKKKTHPHTLDTVAIV